jgi:hypothetical protein
MLRPLFDFWDSPSISVRKLRNVIVHHHIYKNAGTTISYILNKNFGARFSSIHAADAGGLVFKDDLLSFLNIERDVNAITSHHFHTRKFLPYDAGDFAGDITLIDLVLIRHPILRLVSMYEFHRRGGGGDGEQARRAAELDLRNWFEMLLEHQPNMINDVQVSVLSRLGYYASPPSERDLKIARRKIRDFALVGTVEAFDQFCVCAEYFLQPAFGHLDFTYEIQNAHGGQKRTVDLSELESRIGLPLLSDLMRMNRLDLELWKFAGQELERRLAGVYRYSEKLDAFRSRLGAPDRQCGALVAPERAPTQEVELPKLDRRRWNMARQTG